MKCVWDISIRMCIASALIMIVAAQQAFPSVVDPKSLKLQVGGVTSANHMRNNPGNRFSYNQGIRIVRVVEP